MLCLAIFELTKTKNKYYYDIADKDDVTKEPIKSSFSQQCHKKRKFIERIQIPLDLGFGSAFIAYLGPDYFFPSRNTGSDLLFVSLK